MKVWKGISAFVLLCVALPPVMHYLVQPQQVDYEKIAYDIPDKKPAVFSKIKKVLTVCTGEDQGTCHRQSHDLLSARSLKDNVESDYALFVNTGFRDSIATVTLTLSDSSDRTVWRRSASMDSRDSGKAGRNLLT